MKGAGDSGDVGGSGDADAVGGSGTDGVTFKKFKFLLCLSYLTGAKVWNISYSSSSFEFSTSSIFVSF